MSNLRISIKFSMCYEFKMGFKPWSLVRAAADIYRREGWAEVCRRVDRKIRDRLLGRDYSRWIRENERKGSTPRLNAGPLFSVLMPVYNVESRWLNRAIESVRKQTYVNWQLCIADDASTDPAIRSILEKAQESDPRIKVIFRTSNGHISEASNSALSLAAGEWVILLDHDDELAPCAIEELAVEISRFPSAEIVYSDEDKVDVTGRRYDPYFKPDWNPDLFHSQNYLNHLTAYRTNRVREVGGFRTGYEGSQDYDLALRVTEKIAPTSIRHIPKILYHWRAIPNSVALARGEKNYAEEAARKALIAHFQRIDRQVDVLPAIQGWHRTRYALPSALPKVSLIICTKDQLYLLRQIVEGILHETDYPSKELIIVDHESHEPQAQAYLNTLSGAAGQGIVKILRYSGEFNFSAMNNFAVRNSSGQIIALLNNDLKVIHSDWLKEMVSHAIRPEIGAVGARLFYEDGRIQHAGVVLGIGGVAGHAHKGLPQGATGYFGRAQLIQNFSAVTAACMVMRRSVFDSVGGLDEKNLPVAFNDIDFCLRVNEAGFRILYTPYARLYHLESASRGPDDTPEKKPRFLRETDYMKSRWGARLGLDPCYNPNLTLETEDFRLGFRRNRGKV